MVRSRGSILRGLDLRCSNALVYCTHGLNHLPTASVKTVSPFDFLPLRLARALFAKRVSGAVRVKAVL